MKRQSPFLVTLLFLSLIASPIWMAPPVYAEPSETLTVAAANSLKDALRNILPLFEAQHPETSIRVIYGPSQTLRDQIEQGAPVDMFLPSLIEEIEQLEKKGLVINGTKRVYAGTSLVLVTGSTLPTPVTSVSDLRTAAVRRIAIGNPKTSSVGKVAAQFLKSNHLDQDLSSRLVYGDHSRAVLDMVVKGEAEVGVVYRTDAVSNAKVRILDTAPAGSHTPVRYGVAVVWTSSNVSRTNELIEFLLTPRIQALLQEHGFDRVSSEVGVVRRREGK
ncbi:MAG: molybdate ABC transporter substrate-binding protein [Nitrospiraceae bacterium]